MNPPPGAGRPDLTPPRSGRSGVSDGHPADSGQRTPGHRQRTGADMLRYVPPVAALGTAFVLQVVIVTDTLGRAFADMSADTDLRPVGYLSALLLGLAVASCAEGGAAYLMDLYDKHLMARDSVWMLRTAMVGYVVGSGLVIHWWTTKHHLPSVLSWLLAGMSASALFLWSRGSRWRNRQAMIAAGQLDPALPRLPVPSKLMHPIRWLVTLFLISWEPVATTDEARRRYQGWRVRRGSAGARKDQPMVELDALQVAFFTEAAVAQRRAEVEVELAALVAEARAARAEAEARVVRMVSEAAVSAEAVRQSAEREAARVRAEAAELSAAAVRVQEEADRVKAEADTVLAEAKRLSADSVRAARPTSPAPVRLASVNGRTRTGDEVSVEQMADTLREHHGQEYVGKPAALATLKRVYGSCSADRAIEAKNLHNSRREADTRTPEADTSADDAEERSA